MLDITEQPDRNQTTNLADLNRWAGSMVNYLDLRQVRQVRQAESRRTPEDRSHSASEVASSDGRTLDRPPLAVRLIDLAPPTICAPLASGLARRIYRTLGI